MRVRFPPGAFFNYTLFDFGFLGCYWFLVHQPLPDRCLHGCTHALPVRNQPMIPTKLVFAQVAVQVLYADAVIDTSQAALDDCVHGFAVVHACLVGVTVVFVSRV